MSDTVAVALISSIPALFVSVVSIIVTSMNSASVQNTRDAREFVTRQRIVWTETIRVEFSQYVATLREMHNLRVLNNRFIEKDDKTPFQRAEFEVFIESFGKLVAKLNERKTLLTLRLNPVDDKETISQLDKTTQEHIQEKADPDRSSESIRILTELFHSMLKSEWEKIKGESGYKKS